MKTIIADIMHKLLSGYFGEKCLEKLNFSLNFKRCLFHSLLKNIFAEALLK